MSADKPDSLFKFASAATATQILDSQKLRWSAPERFGDPLELSSQSPLGFAASSLLESTIKLSSSMIFAPEKPKGDSPLLNAINRWREDGRFSSPAEAHDVLRELLGKMVDYRVGQLNSNLEKWQVFARNVRVCCFCDQAETLSAWEQFAENHRGIALRFRGKNEHWGTLRPIMYQSERPQITSLREQLGAILHNRPDAMLSRFSEHYFIKSAHHKDEGEWRAYSDGTANAVPVSDTNSDTWYDDRLFTPEALTAIYFGLHVEPQVKEHVIKLAAERYPQTKLLQASLSKTRFNLEFAPVGNADVTSQ